MKILIRNLATSTSQSALEKLFTTYGKVQSCTIVMDQETNKSKGFGFVEMPSVGEARAAMVNLNNSKLHGSKIRVKKADDKKPAPTPTQD